MAWGAGTERDVPLTHDECHALLYAIEIVFGDVGDPHLEQRSPGRQTPWGFCYAMYGRSCSLPAK